MKWSKRKYNGKENVSKAGNLYPAIFYLERHVLDRYFSCRYLELYALVT